MAQYDLLLTQNTHATLVEFSEKYVNIGKGGLLSAAAGGVPTVLPVGADTYQLVADSAQASGLKWEAKPSLAQLHNQNTDTGTTSNIFELGSGGFKIELQAESATKFGVKVDGAATYADLQAKDATFNKVTVVAAPSAGSDLTNKTYVDGIIAANNALVFKGPVTVAAAAALTTYNSGWTYKFTDAGTVWGQVVEIGDILTAIVSRAGTGMVSADWMVSQTNIDGAVSGPAASVADNIATFNAVSGKLIKDSGIAVSAIATAQAAATAAATTANNAIPKATLTAAEQIIVSTGASTPAPLAVAAGTFVGRKATGSIAAMSGAEALVILGAATSGVNGYMTLAYAGKLDGIAPGATANAKATAAEVNTGTDDVKFITPLAIATSNQVRNNAGAFVADRIATFVDTTGRIIKDSGKALSDFLGTWVAAPVAKTSTGVAGTVAKDGNFFYICTATDTWKRSPIATNW